MNYLVITVIFINTLNEIIKVEQGYNLRKNIFAIIHPANYDETAGR